MPTQVFREDGLKSNRREHDPPSALHPLCFKAVQLTRYFPERATVEVKCPRPLNLADTICLLKRENWRAKKAEQAELTHTKWPTVCLRGTNGSKSV